MHPGSLLLASHGIISHIRKQLASKDTLLGVPYLYYNSLVVVLPLPRQIILLIELVNIRSADPSARIASSGLLREPLLMRFPLPFDVVFVRPLIWVLQPSRLLCKLVGEESSLQRHARKPSSVLGPDTLFDFVPFGLDLHPDVAGL